MDNIFKVNVDLEQLLDALSIVKSKEEEERIIEEILDLEMRFDTLTEDVLDYIKLSESKYEMYKKDKERLVAGMSREKKKIENSKRYLLSGLLMSGRSKRQVGTNTISIGTSTSTDVYDEDLIDQEFLSWTSKPDKAQIREAIQRGQIIDGARLVTNQNLQIK